MCPFFKCCCGLIFKLYRRWWLWREKSRAKAKVEPKTWANPNTGGYIQLWNGESSEGWDKEVKGTVARVWASGWCQCLLLVPEPQVQEQAQASPSPKLIIKEPEPPSPPCWSKSSYSHFSPSNRYYCTLILIIFIVWEIFPKRAYNTYHQGVLHWILRCDA